MSSATGSTGAAHPSPAHAHDTSIPIPSAAPAPVYASFTSSSSSSSSKILVHQKSPLLIATPPQITRALAYSHPFLIPLNKVAGLVTWTTGDPWESFLLVSAFWAATLYGDVLIRWIAPILLVTTLVLAMYIRRYSPLSSTGWTQLQQDDKKDKESKVRHYKSLDEIVETLNLFTSRCNILLEPLVRLTDFLSTQRSATSATTQPALITLFIRLVLLTPVWILLTLPPLYIVTTRRVILVVGSIGLTWHSRPARMSRTILWRSRLLRRCLSLITGLELASANLHRSGSMSSTTKAMRDANALAATLKARKKNKPVANGSRRNSAIRSEGIRFSFALFENQRRWLGVGWTTSMLPTERAAWTDEDLALCLQKERFDLPVIDGGIGTWRWCEGSSWTIEGPAPADDDKGKSKAGSGAQDGWIYYDTQWRYPKREDGWGKYTRRRKWVRDAELVEVDPMDENTMPNTATPDRHSTVTPRKPDQQVSSDGTPHPSGTLKRRTTWFGKQRQDAENVSTSPSKNSTLAHQSHQSQSSSDLSTKASTNAPSSTSRTTGTSSAPTSSTPTAKRRNRASTGGSWEVRSTGSARNSIGSMSATKEDERDDDGYVPLQFRGRLQGVVGEAWGIGENIGMELG